jgi:lincosamide nucleotidyltransferase A/C/D/E
MRAQDVVELIGLLAEGGIEVHIDGGWGVDALLGRQTRDHDDLDIAVNRAHEPELRRILGARGFREVPQSANDFSFVLANSAGRKIDVHPYEFDANGNHVYGTPYPIDSLTGNGVIAGVRVKCISAQWAVKFHCQYEGDENDFRDVQALCSEFDIELPQQFKRFLR